MWTRWTGSWKTDGRGSATQNGCSTRLRRTRLRPSCRPGPGFGQRCPDGWAHALPRALSRRHRRQGRTAGCLCSQFWSAVAVDGSWGRRSALLCPSPTGARLPGPNLPTRRGRGDQALRCPGSTLPASPRCSRGAPSPRSGRETPPKWSGGSVAAWGFQPDAFILTL